MCIAIRQKWLSKAKVKLYKDFLSQKFYKPSLNFLNLCQGDDKIVELDHSLWLAPKRIFL